CHRRTLPRRHSLHRRHDALRRIRAQHGPRALHDWRPRLHARRKDSRPALRIRALVPAVSQASARRTVLARPRPPAQRDQDSLLLNWRPARRLPRFHPPHVRASQSAAQGDHWPLESHLPQRRRARPANRMARSSPSLVGLLAQESQHRHHGRTAAVDLHAGLARSRSAPEDGAGEMARRNWLASEERCKHDALSLRRARPLYRPRQTRRPATPLRSEHRRGGRILVGRVAHRPAPRRRLQPHLRFRTAQTGPHHARTAHALLQASASAPQADWFVRLSDVAPDGTVTQVTGAGLNGAQRDSASEPKDLVPNQTYSLDIEMHLATWTFPKGHRIRLAVSNALWPMVWPTPYAMTTTLQLGGDTGSRLTLPLVPPSMYAA